MMATARRVISRTLHILHISLPLFRTYNSIDQPYLYTHIIYPLCADIFARAIVPGAKFRSDRRGCCMRVCNIHLPYSGALSQRKIYVYTVPVYGRIYVYMYPFERKLSRLSRACKFPSIGIIKSDFSPQNCIIAIQICIGMRGGGARLYSVRSCRAPLFISKGVVARAMRPSVNLSLFRGDLTRLLMCAHRYITCRF